MSLIRDMQPGDRVAGAVYLLEEMDMRIASNGQPYLRARLRDEAGQVITALMWDVPPDLVEQLQIGRGVEVEAEVTTWKERLQLKLKRIVPRAVEAAQFLPSSPRPIEEMEQEFRERVGRVGDPHLRALLEAVFFQEAGFWERFRRAPAARQYHHACLGGLLEHSLAVATLAETLCRHYPEVPYDLLLALALLHDIGKVDAYTWEDGLRHSDQGRLLDHTYLGAHRVERAIESLPGFPQELAQRILHAILAHHGEPEKGALLLPKTIEAVALHHIDTLDAHLRGFQEHLEQQADPQSPWTDHSGMFRTPLYRGRGEWELPAEDEELPF